MKVILAILLGCLSFCTLAHEPKQAQNPDKKDLPAKHPSPWDGSNAQIGYVQNRGNTNSSMANLGMNLMFKHFKWSNTLQGQFQYGKENHEPNRKYIHLFDEIQYYLNPETKDTNFLFGNADNVMNYFGPYRYQTIIAAGYGRKWINTDYFKLSGQLGPGYRRSKQQATGHINDSLIATTQMNASLALSSYGTLSQTVRFDMGNPYNYLLAKTAFTNKIVGHVAVQVSYTITYYSKIPPGSENNKKIDTVTNISLVYNY